MSKKEKSGSAAVQSSAEKVKAEDPVVEPVNEPVEKQPSEKDKVRDSILDFAHKYCRTATSVHEDRLFDLFVANVSKVELRSNTRQTIENVSRWAFELSKVELEFFESKIKQEKIDHE